MRVSLSDRQFYFLIGVLFILIEDLLDKDGVDAIPALLRLAGVGG